MLSRVLASISVISGKLVLLYFAGLLYFDGGYLYRLTIGHGAALPGLMLQWIDAKVPIPQAGEEALQHRLTSLVSRRAMHQGFSQQTVNRHFQIGLACNHLVK